MKRWAMFILLALAVLALIYLYTEVQSHREDGAPDERPLATQADIRAATQA